MTEEEIMKLENPELLHYLLIKGDKLVSITRDMRYNKENRDLQEQFDATTNDYKALLCEIVRRMK